jgi:hypothetical protein|tara:strand:+ start:34 stop:456 length:423 start_codon:yes stop_codon:yes gene_type:complete
MTKKSKDYANKVLTLDPLSERLHAAGFTGGASKSLLKKFKKETKSAYKENKEFKVKEPTTISAKGQKVLRQQSLANKLIDNLKLKLKKDTEQSITKNLKETGTKVNIDQISIPVSNQTFKTMRQVDFAKAKLIAPYKRKN